MTGFSLTGGNDDRGRIEDGKQEEQGGGTRKAEDLGSPVRELNEGSDHG